MNEQQRGGLGQSPCIVIAPEATGFSEAPIGDSLGALGDRLIANDERIPLESMPAIEERIQRRVNYWYAERAKPRANVALCDHKINGLTQAAQLVREAHAGMLTAHGGIHEYMGETAIHGSL